MRDARLSIGLRATVVIFTVTLLVTGIATCQETILRSFNGKDGSAPYAGLTFDASGNLYGTTQQGGIYGYGTVFELMPAPGGSWTEKVLHNFAYTTTDGGVPYGGVTFDGSGNLYGTTNVGGADDGGMVYELTPTASGSWTETALYSFGGSTFPDSGVIFDAPGNLYGTTEEGGAYNSGTVFKLTPTAGGSWTETTLYEFNATDGGGPTSGVIFDAFGNLYGTTQVGGTNGFPGFGTAFELTLTTEGSWTETLLHSFNNDGSDGTYPWAGLKFDASGNLYGTTTYGGAYNHGTAFELTPTAGGGWTETVLHSFNGRDGATPYSGLILDAVGDLYGTTYEGGSGACNGNGVVGCGTVFELTPTADGSWTETMLHRFHDNGRDGSLPFAGLIFDASGNLYGTAYVGGPGYNGTVFAVRP